MKHKIAMLLVVSLLALVTACGKAASPAPGSTQQPTSTTSSGTQATKTSTGTTAAQTTKATAAPLSPARNLVGTWKTPFAVKFYIQTDFRTLDGTLEDAASLDRVMTWKITATGNQNEVNIECSASDSNIQQVQVDPPIAYTPDVFPFGFTGTVSTSKLITPMGEFNFTMDTMSGTWDSTDEVLYKQREYTQTGALKLTRQ